MHHSLKMVPAFGVPCLVVGGLRRERKGVVCHSDAAGGGWMVLGVVRPHFDLLLGPVVSVGYAVSHVGVTDGRPADGECAAL